MQRARACPESPTPSEASAAIANLVGKNGKVIASAARRTSGSASTRAARSSTRSRSSRASGRARTRSSSTSRRPARSTSRSAQTIGVEADGPVKRMRISGLVKFGGASSLGGATLAGFDLPTAQALFDKPRQARPDPRVARSRGSTPAAADGEIAEDPAAAAAGADRRGAGDGGRRGHDELHSTSSQDFLLAFGGIALFVGAS